MDPEELEDDLELEQIEDVEEVEEEEAEPAPADDEEELDDESEEADDDEEPAESDEDVIVVSLGGEEEEDDGGTPAIRSLRTANRDQHKRIKELEAKLASQEAPDAELGPKPTLEDVDYDTDRYDEALLSWNERKKAADVKAEEAEVRNRKIEEDYNSKLASYETRKRELESNKVQGLGEAEDAVREGLPTEFQSIIVACSPDPAIAVLALGKNPKVLEKLAASEHAAEFAYNLAKLETTMKVTKSQKPKPEKRVAGRAVAPGTSDKTLATLRAQAAKSGDFSKLNAYKRKLRQS